MTDYPECGFSDSEIENAAYILEIEPDVYREFIDYCITIGLLTCQDCGTIVSERLVENMMRIKSKSQIYSEAALKREAKKREQGYVAPTPPDKPAKPKEEKVTEPDCELSEKGKLIKHCIDAIIKEAKEDTVNKSKHKNSDLTNKQIDALITKYGYEPTRIAVKTFYEWKTTNKQPLKFASDNGSIVRQFIPQAIDKAKESPVFETRQPETQAELNARRKLWFEQAYKENCEYRIRVKAGKHYATMQEWIDTMNITCRF